MALAEPYALPVVDSTSGSRAAPSCPEHEGDRLLRHVEELRRAGTVQSFVLAELILAAPNELSGPEGRNGLTASEIARKLRAGGITASKFTAHSVARELARSGKITATQIHKTTGSIAYIVRYSLNDETPQDAPRQLDREQTAQQSDRPAE